MFAKTAQRLINIYRKYLTFTLLNDIFFVENYTLPISKRLIENVQFDRVIIASIRCSRSINQLFR